MKRQVSRSVSLVMAMLFTILISATARAGIEVTDEAASGVVGSKPPKVELVFVLDTTGSMSGLIASAKEKIWAITNTIVSAKPTPEISIGIVGFRDKRDAYITKLIKMTDDIDGIYQELMSFQAAGGGDTPESVNQALYEAITKNNWDESATTYKVIFLVGDSPPHMDYNDDVKYRQSCELAVDKGIIVNTVQCGNRASTTPVWKEIASITQGEYFQVSQSGGAKHYKTPYDEKISKKSRKLDKTRVYYGDAESKKILEEKFRKEAIIEEKAAPSVKAMRGSFKAKAAGKKNFLGEKELVDAVINNEVKLDDIPEEELPEEMKPMSKEERADYIRMNNDKREQLKQEITELSKKRQSYIEEEVKKEKNKGKDSLDMKIYKSIQKQGAKKNLVYEAEMPTY